MNRDRIIARALDIGFDLAGVGPAAPARPADFQSWLGAGHAGAMSWMGKDVERRLAPHANTALVVGLRYFIQDPPPELWNDPLRGRIARYAWGRDYHDVMRPMLDDLAGFVRAETGSAARAYVDTGPVLERDLAAQAGLGFVGKNTNVIHPEFGSYLFLGEILLDIETEVRGQTSEVGTCGRCTRCLRSCPTGALIQPFTLDARKCISFLTIENKGAIPEELRPKIGNWIFGCDECQQVCPWNEKAVQAVRCSCASVTRRQRRIADAPLQLRFNPDLCAPKLADILALNEADFRDRFAGTPVLRAKRRGLLRNAVVALGNSGDPAGVAILEMAARDPEPLISEHAKWGLRVSSSKFQVPSRPPQPGT